MSKKTNKRLESSLRDFVDFAQSKGEIVVEVEDGKEVDFVPFVMGMCAMAGYVGSVLEGTLMPDPDPDRMMRVLTSVAWIGYLDHTGDTKPEGGDGDDAE